MKILHVCLDFPPRRTRYGSGTVNDDVLRALYVAGNEVTVLTPGRAERQLTATPGIRVIEVPRPLSEQFLLPRDRPTEMFSSPANVHRWNTAAITWLNHEDPWSGWTPDVIFNDGWTTQGVAEHLSSRFSCPVVSTAHVVDRHYTSVGGRTPRPTDSEFRTAEEQFFRSSDRIVVPSSTARELAAHYFPQHEPKLHVVEHGLDWTSLERIPNDRGKQRRAQDATVTVVYLGRISSERGWRPFVEAFRDAQALDSRLRLRIIGDGTRLEEARTQFRHPAVTFCGAMPRHQVWHELLAADVYANPALIETFGVAELEAMGAGLAVVSHLGFGKHTHIDHLVSGIQIPIAARDGHMELDHAAWVQWLTELSANGQMRQRLGRCAQTAARQRFPVERMAAGLLSVFADAIQQAPHRR
ncbi:glycosyltransferase family 4 protein [Hamadaea sp. NPDC051192]|uniref:glycosyltransferase family 4 protein n=1 Tax=Hamadaea sp. NPDC051192 TaxID=3154940 RepID=UPI0034475A33